jgi:hypothetical protein
MKRRHTEDTPADTHATRRRCSCTSAEAESDAHGATRHESIRTIGADANAPPTTGSSDAWMSSRVGPSTIRDQDISMSDVPRSDDDAPSITAADLSTHGAAIVVSAAIPMSTRGDDAITDAPLAIARTRRDHQHSACHVDQLVTVEMQCVMHRCFTILELTYDFPNPDSLCDFVTRPRQSVD